MNDLAELADKAARFYEELKEAIALAHEVNDDE